MNYLFIDHDTIMSYKSIESAVKAYNKSMVLVFTTDIDNDGNKRKSWNILSHILIGGMTQVYSEKEAFIVANNLL